MNLKQAKAWLFDGAFLLGRRRQSKALQFLIETSDAEAISILVDAVEQGHPELGRIQEGGY